MSRHPLQGPLDALPSYLADAARIYKVAQERIDALTATRRKAGATGAGPPRVEGKSLNRAVVVASVGALEAFTEDLALTARDIISSASIAKPWFPIQGSRGIVQTPNSESIAKLMWVYFRYDPRPDWDIVVRAAWSEISPSATHWRGATSAYSGKDAATALDAMVKVRHGFAHQDVANAPVETAGIVGVTPGGKLSLQSHHAFNSMSVVVQLAIQMTHGLSAHMPSTPGRLRWKKAMADWEVLLEGTPAATLVADGWSSQPFE